MQDDMFPEGYQVPSATGGYFKIKQGDNVVRILTKPVLGWVGWIEENDKRSPKRFRMNEKPVDLRIFDKQKVSHFQAYVIWNYEENKVQVWEITQASIMQELQNLYRDEDWGNFREYDIKIHRSGENLETRYSVSPKPKKDTPDQALKELTEHPVYLEQLFVGGDPFSGQAPEVTPEDTPF